MVALTWHASKYKVHKLQQRYIYHEGNKLILLHLRNPQTNASTALRPPVHGRAGTVALSEVRLRVEIGTNTMMTQWSCQTDTASKSSPSVPITITALGGLGNISRWHREVHYAHLIHWHDGGEEAHDHHKNVQPADSQPRPSPVFALRRHPPLQGCEPNDQVVQQQQQQFLLNVAVQALARRSRSHIHSHTHTRTPRFDLPVAMIYINFHRQ